MKSGRQREHLDQNRARRRLAPVLAFLVLGLAGRIVIRFLGTSNARNALHSVPRLIGSSRCRWRVFGRT